LGLTQIKPPQSPTAVSTPEAKAYVGEDVSQFEEFLLLLMAMSSCEAKLWRGEDAPKFDELLISLSTAQLKLNASNVA